MFIEPQRNSKIWQNKFSPKKDLENDFENRAELPPSSADSISLVAPAFSALPSAPSAFSADGQRVSWRFFRALGGFQSADMGL